MLAPYTTRRLPSASRRCSCGISFWEAWQRSVPSGWRAKSCPEKRPARPAQAHVRGSIARGRSRVRWKRWSGWRRWEGRSKLGRAHGIRMQLMPQLQAEVPDPLRYQLPAFLSPGRVRAPAIGSCSSSSSESSGSKAPRCRYSSTTSEAVNRGSWQRGEEQLVDHAQTREANRALLFAGWMGGHNHATLHALRPHWHCWAVVETAHDLTFRTLLDLIGGQVQTRLDEWVVEHRVLFAAGHVGETSQVCQHGPGAILSVEPQQSTRLWELVRCEVTRDRCKSLAQLCAVATVASVAKRAEPLGTVGLTDDGASTHDLATLAPPVAGGTDILQPAMSQG